MSEKLYEEGRKKKEKRTSRDAFDVKSSVNRRTVSGDAAAIAERAVAAARSRAVASTTCPGVLPLPTHQDQPSGVHKDESGSQLAYKLKTQPARRADDEGSYRRSLCHCLWD